MAAPSQERRVRHMIETVTSFPSVRLRHQSAPLLKEREQYLSHLMQRGLSWRRLRCDAAYLIHIVRVLNLNSMRVVSQMEIDVAGQSWATYQGPLRRKTALGGSPKVFIQIAQAWLRFHGQLESPPPHRFQEVLAEFNDAMLSGRGLGQETMRGYRSKVFSFLKWFGERHESLVLGTGLH
jgi:integrase/recombinase XerD